MNPQEKLPLFAVDRVVVLLFVLFLASAEAQQLLNQSGLRWAYLLLLSFGLAYVLTPLVYAAAHRFGAIDLPAGRKAHGVPTALLGGVAVYGAFAITVLRNFAFSDELKGIALASSLILVVGVLDDLRELSARVKLLAQLLAVAILIHYGVVISILPPTPWGMAGEWALTAFWVIGITNAINFLDGMDGLAAGACGINALFFSLVALQNDQFYMMFLAMPILGACLGFLVYNFRPGRRAWIFLGDGGSTFLGFTLSAVAVMGDWGHHHVVGLIVPVLILGVPIFDMTFTTIMRIWGGQVRSPRQWLEYTGRDHIHHRLEDLRIGRVGSVLVVYIVTTWLGLSALALGGATGLNAILQVAQSVVVFLLLGFFMVFVGRQYTHLKERSGGDDPPG
ncbi:MAG: undecaprenyl/decaprenyl-phosphate alpha-N-acetylglucosaminyl 1-phosphate transferase [Gemmatimonadetes bacterium]|nr:undecaprenyl/decaprenyl-phosphate alpha-N-acetylglucosaminyl 1-phosphate transferase [Gemmatimonadota bacterium]MBT6145701.1 undecaprenyl/decaprenyl-phosphate alpha-N-acetylglucosaminyl 1-phosphate transferase [Gemmatimonadota bacterium]MBT7859681.1 undecaprenyl/decaprenyl-phosphate alpha-N-acetylglucosaminyl 1-phosphate transferase [Gemmatimonadota bacterium]